MSAKIDADTGFSIERNDPAAGGEDAVGGLLFVGSWVGATGPAGSVFPSTNRWAAQPAKLVRGVMWRRFRASDRSFGADMVGSPWGRLRAVGTACSGAGKHTRGSPRLQAPGGRFAVGTDAGSAAQNRLRVLGRRGHSGSR
jgi:hypothetical protein